jgi:hypothetical protein
MLHDCWSQSDPYSATIEHVYLQPHRTYLFSLLMYELFMKPFDYFHVHFTKETEVSPVVFSISWSRATWWLTKH